MIGSSDYIILGVAKGNICYMTTFSPIFALKMEIRLQLLVGTTINHALHTNTIKCTSCSFHFELLVLDVNSRVLQFNTKS